MCSNGISIKRMAHFCENYTKLLYGIIFTKKVARIFLIVHFVIYYIYFPVYLVFFSFKLKTISVNLFPILMDVSDFTEFQNPFNIYKSSQAYLDLNYLQ